LASPANAGREAARARGLPLRLLGCQYCSYFLPFGFCARALPAADLDALLVRPSRSVLDAAEAAFELVCFAGALCCDKALPAADFDFPPVDFERIVFEALLAAFLLVTFLFTITLTLHSA